MSYEGRCQLAFINPAWLIAAFRKLLQPDRLQEGTQSTASYSRSRSSTMRVLMTQFVHHSTLSRHSHFPKIPRISPLYESLYFKVGPIQPACLPHRESNLSHVSPSPHYNGVSVRPLPHWLTVSSAQNAAITLDRLRRLRLESQKNSPARDHSKKFLAIKGLFSSLLCLLISH